MKELFDWTALARDLPRVTAIIGAGGKTTLLFALGERLARQGRRVILTTTTHLGCSPEAVSPPTPEALNGLIRPKKALLVGYGDESGHKMTGVPAEWYSALEADHILVEADGSRNLPLKVHRSFEPVLPPDTGLLIQLAGLSALGRTVRETVHCCDCAGLNPEAVVDETLIARLLLRGFAHTGFAGPKLALLNQADTPELVRRGRIIAGRLEAEGIQAGPIRLKENEI